jgi:hypothetical protein
VVLGDFGNLVNLDVQGEMLVCKMTVNWMVTQLGMPANKPCA